MKTIKDILISADELDRLYLGHTPVNLWRATRADTDRAKGVLHPRLINEEARGRILERDIETYVQNGQTWVRSALLQGVSLFDRPHVFSGRHWEYFLIPSGTEIPEGLAITRDHYQPKFEATHYSILPNHDMPAETYMKLLDHLARNALRRREVGGG